MCSQNQTVLLSSSSDAAADESTSPSYSIYQGTLTSSSSSFHHPLASDPPPPTGNVSGDVSGEEQNLHTIPLSDESTSASNPPTLSGVVSGNVSGEEQSLQTILLSDKSTSTSSFHHPLDSDPTGDVSGDISGDVSGEEQNLHTILLSDESTSASSFLHPLDSNPPGDVSCNVSGDVSGNVSGDVSGEEQNLHTILLSDELTSASFFHHPLATSPGSDPLSPPAGDEQHLQVDESNSSSSFHHPLASSPDSDPLSPPSDDVSGEVCDYLRVSVSDPKKETDSGSKDSYVTYLITTETDLVDYKGAKFGVRRRFKEFVLLSERLGEAYRGFFVPVRPDKGLVEGQVMQKQEFVEQRRVAVERYLRRLARHTVIRRSEELRVFLIGEGRVEFGRGNEIALKTKLARGGDLMRLFRGVKQRVRVDWGGGREIIEEEDKEFLEKKENLNQLEKELTNASKQVLTWFTWFGLVKLVVTSYLI